jgi:hypothetical protein
MNDTVCRRRKAPVHRREIIFEEGATQAQSIYSCRKRHGIQKNQSQEGADLLCQDSILHLLPADVTES